MLARSKIQFYFWIKKSKNLLTNIILKLALLPLITSTLLAKVVMIESQIMITQQLHRQEELTDRSKDLLKKRISLT